MSGEMRATIVGNLGDDAELRFTPSGAAVCQFSVANTPRKLDRTTNEWKDDEPTWVRVVAWRNLAQNAADTLKKGMRVIVTGELANRKWEDREGGTRYSLEMTADAIGPDLTFVTASLAKGVHDGARDKPSREPKKDPFDEAQAARPAANGAANADTQRAQQGPAPDFAQQPPPAGGGAFADL
jgi:single-strand DNA-binding protein